MISVFFLSFGTISLAQGLLIDSLNQQAYQRYRENVEEAKMLAYRALSLVEDGPLENRMVDSYINLGRCFRLTNQWDSAYQVLEQAIKISREAKYDTGLVNATNNLGACYLMQDQVQEASSWFRQSLEASEKTGNQKGQANALNNLFIIAQQQQDYDSALIFLNRATLVYEQIGDSSGLANAYSNKGFLLDIFQQIDSAIFYYFEALAIQDSLGLTYQQAISYNRIGKLYADKKQHTDALKYYEKALVLFEEIGDITELANTHNYMGNTLSLQSKYAEALPHLEKGLAYARQTEVPFWIGINLISLASFYRQQNRDDQLVRELFEEAVDQLKETNTFNLAAAYNGLGHLALKQGKLDEAKSWFENELETAKEFGEPNSQLNALDNLAGIYERQNRPDMALRTLRQYHELRDSVEAVETLETINNLNIQYETEKKERENLELQNDLKTSQLAEAEQKVLRNRILGISALLLLLGMGGFIWYRYRQRIRMKEQEMELEQERARQEQRRKEAEKLRELDAMKTRFFTNISHEFRTPLTLIIGKNDQLKAAIDDPKHRNGFEMVGRNGHRLLDLVNQVLDVAKLEAGGMTLSPSRLDAIPYLKHILYSFESMGEEKGVKLTFESDVKKLDTAFDPKKMERVIFNLLSNAMKFTPDGGNIQMRVKRKENTLEIAIEDSGVGMKASQLPYIFDRFYQADSSENQPQPGTGIGLSLVKELVELHDGTVEVKSELNKGTTFVISLPIP
ncbi:MAG: tetratricopeptide repeat protein, partial [Bacteroidetes bacterium]|nr:tetratricopeptide repeat protein [Bacteroidota bacterium]